MTPPPTTLAHLVERDRAGGGDPAAKVRVAAVAALPTRFGNFDIVAFVNQIDGKEHVAIVHGDIVGGDDVPTRLHSECLTGDVMGSLRCDCRDQLETALRKIAAVGRGLVLYLRQEGRGIGLLNKVRAYGLQDRGLDTVDANLALGFADDERDYAIAGHILASLTVRSVQLMTNNPKKLDQLAQVGVAVSGRVPHIIPPNPHNLFYLQTKASRSGHWLDFSGRPHVPEQGEPVVVAGMPKVAPK